MAVQSFDHVALPVADPRAMIEFYGALGFRVPDYDSWRESGRPLFTVKFGDNKINMHAPSLWQDKGFALRAPNAQPGCGDLCFVWADSEEALVQALERAGAPIEEGPVERVGGRALGRARGQSVYTRDPDNNLLEFIIY